MRAIGYNRAHPVVKKHVESEVKRINEYTNKPKAKLMVNEKVSKKSERNYNVKIKLRG